MRLLWFGWLSVALWGQETPGEMAAAMLMKVDSFTQPTPYSARPGCQPIRHTSNIVGTALQQWSFHCLEANQAVRAESFYYVFDLEHPQPVPLRLDVRTESHTAATPEELEAALTAQLTARYGRGDRQPELHEIGFHRTKRGELINGLHWNTGHRHIFLHRNPSHSKPLGIRTGVQLIVLDQRLLDERTLDVRISRTRGPSPPLAEKPSPDWTPQRLWTAIETRLSSIDRNDVEAWAQALVDVDRLIVEGGYCLIVEGQGDIAREHPLTPVIRRALASQGAKLGGLGHYGGMAYNHDLLWRVWRTWPGTTAGAQAFASLQSLGWPPETGSANGPDRFRVVIWRGEAFLSERPGSIVRNKVLLALATAYESWWSIGLAGVEDSFLQLASPAYLRRQENQRRAPEARRKAIAYYEELILVAPASDEAVAARRQLPRLKLGLDTGCRQYFSTEC